MRGQRRERGAALVEFALVALLLYLFVGAIVELGRAVLVAQSAQGAARVLARELSLTEVEATATFAETLPLVFAEEALVIDLDLHPPGDALDALFASLPPANRALRPLMIFDQVELDGETRRLLRFPGALWRDAEGSWTVKVPLVTERGPGGLETIELRDVVEEAEPGTFPVTGDPDDGIASVRINVPFQAAALSGFRESAAGPLEPNVGESIVADDDQVTVSNAPAGEAVDALSAFGVHAGRYGLGAQQAFATEVRPFRKLVRAHAYFRREVFAP